MLPNPWVVSTAGAGEDGLATSGTHTSASMVTGRSASGPVMTSSVSGWTSHAYGPGPAGACPSLVAAAAARLAGAAVAAVPGTVLASTAAHASTVHAPWRRVVLLMGSLLSTS